MCFEIDQEHLAIKYLHVTHHTVWWNQGTQHFHIAYNFQSSPFPDDFDAPHESYDKEIKKKGNTTHFSSWDADFVAPV